MEGKAKNEENAEVAEDGQDKAQKDLLSVPLSDQSPADSLTPLSPIGGGRTDLPMNDTVPRQEE